MKNAFFINIVIPAKMVKCSRLKEERVMMVVVTLSWVYVFVMN